MPGIDSGVSPLPHRPPQRTRHATAAESHVSPQLLIRHDAETALSLQHIEVAALLKKAGAGARLNIRSRIRSTPD
jgi:hypothetical protein